MVSAVCLAYRLQPKCLSALRGVQRGATETKSTGPYLPGEEVVVATEDRGFASMERIKQREIASKGGKAAHQKGTAHEWTSEEAREAGRKGGMASHRRKQEQQDQSVVPPSAPDTNGGEQMVGNEEIR